MNVLGSEGRKEASQMARIPKMVIRGEPTVYLIISRIALNSFVR
jgi:hypothetical protein